MTWPAHGALYTFLTNDIGLEPNLSLSDIYLTPLLAIHLLDCVPAEYSRARLFRPSATPKRRTNMRPA